MPLPPNILKLASRFAKPKTEGALQVYSRLVDKLSTGMAGKPQDVEYFTAEFPSSIPRRLGILKGDVRGVNTHKSKIWRETTSPDIWGKDTSPEEGTLAKPLAWDDWGTVHNHPDTSSWLATPPSGKDWRHTVVPPQNSKNLVVHTPSGVLEAYEIYDLEALRKFDKTGRGVPYNAFEPTDWLRKTEGLTIPKEFESVPSAIMRAYPEALKSRGIVDTANTGTDAENALIQEWAEDWAKRVKFAKGGVVGALNKLRPKVC